MCMVSYHNLHKQSFKPQIKFIGGSTVELWPQNQTHYILYSYRRHKPIAYKMHAYMHGSVLQLGILV